MFGNLNWYHILVLLLLALFIFGDKLPQVIADTLRMLRNLRRMAQNATSDLSRELGTDLQLEDLHPKTFIRKHILSEADQEALLKPLKGVSEDMMREAKGLESDFKEVGRRTERVASDVREATGRRRGGDRNLASKPGQPPAQSTKPDQPAPAASFDDIT
ncbi:MAG TPA: preprotein translocase subunit TatB [Natronosporangium sp.]